MGAAESSVYVYLGQKDGTDRVKGVYTLKVSRITPKICKNFERVHYRINYNKKPSRDLIGRNPYYNVSICSGTDYYNKGNCIFRYYCTCEKKIIRAVNVYYSSLLPNDPLIIVFITKDFHGYRFTYSNLKTRSYAYSYDFITQTFRKSVKEQLPLEYNNKSGGKKITFILEKKTNTSVNKDRQPILKDNKFKKTIYTSGCSQCKVYYSDLFEYNTQIDIDKFDCSKEFTVPKNFIDSYFLKHVENKALDGIIVYYTASANRPENVSYLVEFIDSCNDKSQYVRKDKFSTYWVKEEHNYKNENELSKNLDQIKKKADENDVLTYIIEKKEKYFCVEVKNITDNKKPNTQDGFSKYSHTSKRKGVKPNIVLNLQILKQDGKEFTHQLEGLEAYFLKDKEKKEDDTPFLIVFQQASSLKPPDTSTVDMMYISKPCEDPREWKLIVLTEEVLKERLEQIEKIPREKTIKEKVTEKEKDKGKERGKEIGKTVPKTFKELRKEACDILEKAVTVPGFPSKPGPPTVPPGKPKVPDEEYGLTLSQKIVITIGAVLASSVVGGISYGVYWYQTTIKLLT
ncbi:conserved hypothetical protein [Theileria orientalis strain Shintoku]|uniref:Uncharacterized protein n=1 Tax=Theileria orientalis strain Shintoku TaxID=869250 RepID=J4CD74_THEOR|nr:conserved hypothetical protein [Theileria orientalis strain Shintoku]BAM40647.1 conserved hypothetical protein [Theileria orientalis strain Shintoku]|eukprot:XP_009690948.1 conserved hypothetical protein [Theileria orientalis strain Shintoku]